jgi:hypothetical protein
MVVTGLSGRFPGRNLVTTRCFNGSLCLFWPLRGQKRYKEPLKHRLVTKFRLENRPENPNHHFDPIWVPLRVAEVVPQLTLPVLWVPEGSSLAGFFWVRF